MLRAQGAQGVEVETSSGARIEERTLPHRRGFPQEEEKKESGRFFIGIADFSDICRPAVETRNFPDVRSSNCFTAETDKVCRTSETISACAICFRTRGNNTSRHYMFACNFFGFWLRLRDSNLNLPVRLIHQRLWRVDTSRSHGAVQR